MRDLERERIMTAPEPWEATTWMAAARRMQLRPCVCGRSVRADRMAPADGVSHHNRTREHQAWRAEHGL